MTRLDTAQETLKKAGLRMTSTRHVILQLMSDQKTFYTIEQIAQQAGERKMDTVTVYRIMQAFEELRLVHKLLSVNGFVSMMPADENQYCFFIDEKTQQVIRQVVESYKIEGFTEHQQHTEVLGTFTHEKNWESVSPQIESTKNNNQTIKQGNQEEQGGGAVTIEKKRETIAKEERENTRQQKKKLHQKLREF